MQMGIFFNVQLTLNTFSLFTWPKPWKVDCKLFKAYNNSHTL